MSDKEIIAELRSLLVECAIHGDRVIFGACHVFTCRMCGGNDVHTSGEFNHYIHHTDYCPVGKILEATKKYKKAA